MTGAPAPVTPSPTGDGVDVRVKVVPGASRDALAGRYGDRLRVRVGAPPEGGKANRALLALLAGALDLAPRDLEVVEGRSSPRKTVRVRGLAADEVTRRLLG